MLSDPSVAKTSTGDWTVELTGDSGRLHRAGDDGSVAVVTDLESRNGTQVVAPGQTPVRLRPSEPTPVLPDTVIDLGGGWTIQVVVR